MPELSDEHEIIASHMSAMTAAFQVLVQRLEQNGSLERNEFPEALRNYMEIAKGRQSDVALALLDDLRQSLLH